MKKFYFVLSGLSIFLIFVVISLLNVEWFENENSIKTLDLEKQFNSQAYGVTYDEILNRITDGYVMFQETDSQGNCFSLDYLNFPEKVSSSIDQAIEDLKENVDRSSKSRFDTAEGFTINNSEAIQILGNIQFEMEKSDYTNKNPLKLTDHYYEFTCNIEKQGNLYKLVIEFENLYPSNIDIPFVIITTNQFGTPTLSQSDLKLVRGAFNNSVIFYNQLNEDIQISVLGPSRFDEENNVKLEYIIPQDKKLNFWFNVPTSAKDSLEYSFFVEPYNLEGKVNAIKPNFTCLSLEETKDLYTLGPNNLKFPDVPENYSFKCGRENANFFVWLFYWDDSIGEFNPEKHLDPNGSFVADGGLLIAYSGPFTFGWESKSKPEILQSAQRYCELNKDCLFKIGNFWGYFKGNYGIKLVSEENEWYEIKANLPKEELLEIAESLT